MGNLMMAACVVPLHRLMWITITCIRTRRVNRLSRRVHRPFRDTVFYFDPPPPPQEAAAGQSSGASSPPEDGRGRGRGRGGIVALTIDDGLSSSGSGESCMVEDVLRLLNKFGVRATFFPVADYVTVDDGTRMALRDLVRKHGHDVGNHCKEDKSYAKLSEEDFSKELAETNRVLESIVNGDEGGGDGGGGGDGVAGSDGAGSGDGDGDGPSPVSGDEEQGRAAQPTRPFSVRWFRAPCGQLSPAMTRAVSSAGMVHVLGDVYADDWALSRRGPAFVARTMLRQVRNGSICICHMPDRALGREECLRSLEMLLEGLEERGMKVVSLAEMWEICGGRHALSQPD